MDRRSAASSRSGLTFLPYRGLQGVSERRRESKQILLAALIAVSGGEEGELVNDADDATVGGAGQTVVPHALYFVTDDRIRRAVGGEDCRHLLGEPGQQCGGGRQRHQNGQQRGFVDEQGDLGPPG